MAKTGPLGKLEKYYIEGNYQQMDVADLAKEMDRSKTAVKNYIKKLSAVKEEEVAQEFKVGEKIPVNNNPIVMTETEASRADAISQRRGVLTQRMADCIAPSKRAE